MEEQIPQADAEPSLPEASIDDLIQARVAAELDRRVAERTATLAAANDELRHRLAEQARGHDSHVIDGIPALVLVLSPAGEIERANQRALAHFGGTLADLRRSAPGDLIHPHDLPRATEQLAAGIPSGEAFDVELRIRRADGVYPWFLARTHPLRDERGRIEQWYVLATDIDERKRVEDELRVRELSVRLLVESLDSIPALAIVSNEAGEIVFANQQVLDYYDRSLEDVKRWPTTDSIVHPDDLEHANRTVAEALAAGVPCHDEYRLRRFDGVYRWFEGRYSPVRDAAGRIVNWFVMLIDIDDRKRSEEEVRRSEAFLAEGQRLSATGSFHWRVATDELTWSEQLYRIFDVDPDTPVRPETFRARVHPEDVAVAGGLVAQARSDGRDFEAHHRLLLPDGSVRHVHLVAHAIRGGDGGLEYMGAVQDVTQRRLAEEGLNKVRSELAHVGRVMSLGALTASIAHEVSQPLSGIMANAGASLRMLAADPPDLDRLRETAQRTLRDANRASDVVARLRALFSKKQATSEPVDLNAATREVLTLSASELSRGGVVVRTDLAADLPAVRGDKVQLQQVVLNLVLNAADAMGAVDDRPRDLTVATRLEDAGQVRLSVLDTGVGFDPQEVEKLFDAFHTTKTQGMGIGLSISRSIIEAHDGRLWAEPNDGPGATFSFVLPIGDALLR
jgi:PAS domain S-box-containing protein